MSKHLHSVNSKNAFPLSKLSGVAEGDFAFQTTVNTDCIWKGFLLCALSYVVDIVDQEWTPSYT